MATSHHRRDGRVDETEGAAHRLDEVLAQISIRAAAFNRLSTGAVVLDSEGVVLDSNESWRLFTHLNDGDIETTGRGANYLEVCDRAADNGAQGAAEVAAGLRAILIGNRERFDLEYPCPSPIEDRWFLFQAAAAPVASGSGVVVQHVDVTAKRLAAEALASLAEHDPLTGLANRRAAISHLEQQITAVHGTKSAVSVMFIDLDGFKAVNDQHGHHVGDELLVKIAGRLRRIVRAQDLLCRLGGDEFLLVCTGLEQKEARLAAHRIRTVMSAPFQIGNLEVIVGASVGLAAGGADSCVQELIDAADAEMYLDKRGAPRRRELGRAVAKPCPSIPWPAGQLPSTSPSSANPSCDAHLVAALNGLQARAHAAFAHSRDLVIFFAMDGTVLSASPATRAMFGLEPEDLVGLNSLNLVHPDDQERVFLEVASIPNLGDSFRAEFRVVDQAGNIRWLEEIATNLIDDPNVGCFVGNLRDVTDRVELTRQIEADRQRLADAQASAKLGSFELDIETGVVHRSAELWRMLGLEPNVPEHQVLRFGHPEDRRQVAALYTAALAGEPAGECVHRMIRADGEVRWVRTEMSRTGGSNSTLVTGTVLDITDQHRAEEALAHQATHDWLTQLPNVASLHAKLHASLDAADHDDRVALALIDVDDFKLVNDRNGHTIGDAVLRGLADRLVAGLPSGDWVARFDGDGFAVVRRNVRSDDDARELGDAIVAVLSEPLTVGEHGARIGVTAAVGVALSAATDTAGSLLRDADDALHQAKTCASNRVTVFDDDARARAHRRRSLVTALPLALDRGEFHVVYQPVIDLSTLATVGFEALLRWQHPTLGPIAPLEFIPLAEASGEILPIGHWVIGQAAHQLGVWRADPRTPDDLSMAINVSAVQLSQPMFTERVATAVRQAKVPRSAVRLEITESVLVDRVDHALRTIQELRDAGFNVGIDDFGTGYSSLSYLSRMPVDTLKIDRAFVAGLVKPGPAASIVRTIIALADSLHLDTVAEGIESPLQLELLRTLGCRHGQGFLWSPGLPPCDAQAFMVERAGAALPIG